MAYEINGLRGTKIHVCERCGCRFAREVTLQGMPRTSTRKGIERALARMIARGREKAQEPFRCPSCDHIQASMVAAEHHRRSLRISVALSAAALALFIWRFGDVGGLWPWLVGVVVVASGLLAHHRVLRKRVVTIARGETLSEGPEEPAGERGTRVEAESSGPWLLPLACLLLAGLGLASTRVWSPAHGGVRNPDWSPIYLGPGEMGKVSFEGSVRSLDRRWFGRGTASLSGLPDDYTGDRELPATGGRKSWSGRLKTKVAGGEVTPFAWVRFPDDPALAGHTLGVDITMDVTYPVWVGVGTFDERTESFELQTTVTLSPRGAGEAFARHWNTVTVVSLALVMIGTWWITLGLDRRRRGPGDFVPDVPA